MPKKTKRRDSQAYNYVMRRVHKVQLEDVVANTRTTITKDHIADKPSQAELDQIKPSCDVKVFENYEIFWVTVLYVSENDIAGVVNNHLLKEHLFGYGDIIWLKKSDVIAVFWPTA
jgi:uncharacterized protein YegJ (DUF2314 family)